MSLLKLVLKLGAGAGGVSVMPPVWCYFDGQGLIFMVEQGGYFDYAPTTLISFWTDDAFSGYLGAYFNRS